MIIWRTNMSDYEITNDNTKNEFRRLTIMNEHDNKHTNDENVNVKKIQTY